MDEVAHGLGVFIIFLGFSSPVIVVGLVYYFVKRLEHKRIIAAIEKGVSISELGIGTKKQKKNEGPGWIKDQSKGITLLIIGLGIGFVLWNFGSLGLEKLVGIRSTPWVCWIIPIVFSGNGIGLIVRSRMRKKYEKPAPAEELSENNTD